MIDEWDLAATNQRRIRERHYEVAVIPIGSLEAHNQHLPEGTDWLLVDHVARESCRRAWEKCQGVLCVPGLPYSSDCNLMGFPMTIDVSQATVNAVITDIVRSLRHHGIRKFFVLNGHGGNHFIPLVRVLQHDMDVQVFLCNWWTLIDDRYGELFEKPDDHAGEMETSSVMAVYPELVELDRAGDGEPAPFRFEALRRGWIQTARDFARMNPNCAVGDPRAASAEKGRACLELACTRLAGFLVELATTPIDATFPFAPGSEMPG